jgi:hypothetical protein
VIFLLKREVSWNFGQSIIHWSGAWELRTVIFNVDFPYLYI